VQAGDGGVLVCVAYDCTCVEGAHLAWAGGGQTLSFLAYIIRQYPNLIRGTAAATPTPPIPWFVLQLMQNCPAEAASTRKVQHAVAHLLGRSLSLTHTHTCASSASHSVAVTIWFDTAGAAGGDAAYSLNRLSDRVCARDWRPRS
jgi:hypothetical protein